MWISWPMHPKIFLDLVIEYTKITNKGFYDNNNKELQIKSKLKNAVFTLYIKQSLLT